MCTGKKKHALSFAECNNIFLKDNIGCIGVNNTVITEYLPVGGGGGGSDGPASSGSVLINYITPITGDGGTIRAGEDYIIKYRLTMTNAAGDPVYGSGKATWYINGVPHDGGYVKNGEHEFNVGPYLSSYVKDGINKISLSIAADTGGSVPTTGRTNWEITIIILDLEWKFPYDPKAYIDADRFALTWTPIGN